MAIDVKKLLSEAIIELSYEKPLRKITINDITKRAGTGRQTFYNHFRDKNDLIYWDFLRTLAGEKRIMKTDGFFAYLYSLHKKAQEKQNFLTQACKLEGQNSLSEAIFNQTYTYYRNCIIDHFGQEAMTEKLEFSLLFNAYGATSMYIHWAEMEMPGSAEEQARYALHCIPQSLKKYLPIKEEDLVD